MDKNTDIQSYFMEHVPPGIMRSWAINGLHRGRVETMSQLCQMPLHELKRIRNIGAKTLEVVLPVREKYMAEQGN